MVSLKQMMLGIQIEHFSKFNKRTILFPKPPPFHKWLDSNENIKSFWPRIPQAHFNSGKICFCDVSKTLLS